MERCEENGAVPQTYEPCEAQMESVVLSSDGSDLNLSPRTQENRSIYV